MITDDQAENALEFIKKQAGAYAKAKADRLYIEGFLKSKKALLMKDSSAESSVAQERDAYAHVEYMDLLLGYREAVEAEETLRWQITAAEVQIDIYRTQESTKRAMVKV